MIRHDLPNGRTVFFDPEPHVYYDAAGSEFYGVTTVIKDIGGGPPASYYEKNAYEKFQKAIREMPWGGWGDLPLEDLIERLGSPSKEIFEDAGTTGTAVHKVFEALPSGDIPSDIPEVEADRVARLVQWWNENVEETYHSEIVVASHSQGYAGTVDWVGRIKGQNGVGIIDLKTSNYVQPKYHFQLDGYREAYMESGYGETQWQAVLHLPKNKPLRFVPGKAAPGAFRAQLDSFKHQKHISPPRRKPAPNLPLAA
jgi:hypothetical protein